MAGQAAKSTYPTELQAARFGFYRKVAACRTVTVGFFSACPRGEFSEGT